MSWADSTAGEGTKRVLLPTSAPNYEVDQATGDVRIRPREKLLERLPATAGRNAAFDALHERLTVATEFFQHHGDGGRYGVERAMSDLIDYLTSRGIPQATLIPIEAVLAAIHDAKNGAPSPIFKPDRKPTGGKPPKAVALLEFEAILAVVMECCVRHCRAGGQRPFVDPAAQLATKLINEAGWLGRVAARELIELRERVQQRQGGIDRREYDSLVPPQDANPLDWAKNLLAHEWVNPPPKFPDNPGC